ncbi:hypothetical protein EVAR_94058_1 [Eumeta japonica]|uniref:Uncharacterized protein n=1 Tax=Eumeta variegata TaxID=151549 RepID=A0A4C1V8G8_EUMVA|nr:hypothetical protein EVAR_94058_1 [Eumeta japonica]
MILHGATAKRKGAAAALRLLCGALVFPVGRRDQNGSALVTTAVRSIVHVCRVEVDTRHSYSDRNDGNYTNEINLVNAY